MCYRMVSSVSGFYSLVRSPSIVRSPTLVVEIALKKLKILKITWGLGWAFLQRIHTNGQEMHEKMSSIIREMQIKMKMTFHFTSSRIDKMKG